MKKFHLLVAFSLVFWGLGLIGCSSMPSVNQESAKNNKATYNKDFMECREDYPEVESGAHYWQWIGCMNLKGWK